jgi:hypothetical protein
MKELNPLILRLMGVAEVVVGKFCMAHEGKRRMVGSPDSPREKGKGSMESIQGPSRRHSREIGGSVMFRCILVW